MKKNKNKYIEILAPARDIITAKSAILCGADAIYIAATGFSLRKGFECSLEDIEEITKFAHKYWVKVYITLNSLMFTEEDFCQVELLIKKLKKIGIDGLIIQDMGLLEINLQNIPIIASTNTNCFTKEKIKFFEDIGLSMIVLPRELNIDEIKEISNKTNIKLEAFCFGLLCVGYSGRCYLEYAKNVLTHKFSENLQSYQYNGADNGKCSQNCFNYYNLVDANGNYIVKNERLLNLHFNNQIDNMELLYKAGVTSFKIEGRHKELAYIKNVTAAFSEKADEIRKKFKLNKASSGKSCHKFVPNLNKVFNKGFTDYFTTGRKHELYSKNMMIGEKIGTVSFVDEKFEYFTLNSKYSLNINDKIRYTDNNNNIKSLTITNVKKDKIYANNINKDMLNKEIFLFFDYQYNHNMEKEEVYRYIDVNINFYDNGNNYTITAIDEDNNKIKFNISKTKRKHSLNEIKKKLSPQGEEEFSFIFEKEDNLYISTYKLKNLLYRKLRKEREKNRPKVTAKIRKNNIKYPHKVNYLDNVVNEKAVNFYKRHKVSDIEMGLETNINITNKQILTSKYCIRYEMNLCKKLNSANCNKYKEPLYLEDTNGLKYIIKNDCQKCEMSLVVPNKEK